MSNPSNKNSKQRSGCLLPLIIIIIAAVFLINRGKSTSASHSSATSQTTQAEETTDTSPEQEYAEPEATPSTDPLAFMNIPMPEGDKSNSAPYISLTEFWAMDQPYRTFSTDWRCDLDAENTYYNVHCWYGAADNQYNGIQNGSGYAGFQNVNGGHIAIFSMWATADATPTVEYMVEGARSDSFYGEGTGTKVLIPYDWQVGIWYNVQINACTKDGKTYFTFAVTPEGGDGEILAVMSLPFSDMGMPSNISFLEDFTYNGLERGDSLRNFYAETWDGTWITPQQVVLYAFNNKLQEEANNTLRATYSISEDGTISLRGSGWNLTDTCVFPAYLTP